MKKIKKETPIPPVSGLGVSTEDLLSFIKAENREPMKKEISISYKNIPSKRGIFRKWKEKEITNWSSQDFLGYFLQKHVDILNEECIDFKRANSYTFVPEKKKVKDCLEFVFSGDKEKFKDYIDFILPWWTSSDSWVDDYPKFASIFTQKSTFYSVFVSFKNTKPKKMTRQQLDNHFASSEAWADFPMEGGDE